MHDPAHNILAAANSKDEAKQQASATQVKGNRLAFRGDTHYRYDIHGNRIAELRGKGQKLQTRYHYNSRQQLVRVEKLKVEKGTEQFQQVIHYQYDPLGRRIGKVTNSEQTEFLWDSDVLLQENKTDNQTKQDLSTRTYYFEPGTFKPVALKESEQDKEQVYHYHLDHLGTPDTLTNQEGEVVWSVAYKSYGNIALAHENQIEQPIRFQGQYFDEETGLHYNRFRYYDPQVGEFIQQDPIGLLGGANNYRYVPNPVRWVDPFGLSCKEGSLERDTGLTLNDQISGGVPEGHAGHHILSIKIAQQYPVMHKAAELGYNINRGSNGIALPTDIDLAKETGLPLHTGRHLSSRHDGSADKLVHDEPAKIQKGYDAGEISDENLLSEISSAENTVRDALVNNEVRLQKSDPHWGQ
ncbi:RHS repeat-associated core domain-containing protein [Microbulbifer sp. SSSA007]|uniref:RHS repeat-associated core domain-containing protein n=1 Tax=Microbulbifer sp. SSSA007 TaxID=3243379 RepID=UPI004039D6D1